MKKEAVNRKEIWMRIPVLIVTGIILGIWRYLIYVFFLVNFLYGIFTGKRLKEICELSETWNTQVYDFFQYINFVTNKRPFPFSNLKNSISKFK